MGFPNIHQFPESHPGPYERQMGGYIVGLLHAFDDRVPDAESHARVAELAANPSRWSAGHAVFDEIQGRFAAVVDKFDESEYGKFGWVIDPEGNKVELWEPPEGQ